MTVFAIPTVLTSGWRPAVERAAQERGAQSNRLARHLFTIATTAAPGKEVRVTGIGERLVNDRRAAWDRWYGPVAAARWGSAWWLAAGWAIFGLAYVGAVVFVSSYLRAPASSVLLVLAAGARLSGYIGATVGEIGFLRGFWMDGSRRLAWLEDYAASVAAMGDLPVPPVLQQGVRFEHVSFAYPGTSRVVLEDVSLMLPAGAVVAVVGENGAGKTTLVKLLAKMYEPSSGTILVDETPLARLPAVEWRERLAGAFQDFFRFEFRAGHTVGLGDVPRIDDEPAVPSAVERAGAADVMARLASGLEYAARSNLAQWSRAFVRTVAKVGPGAWVYARSAAVTDSRRANRRARCGDRTRSLRALRRSRAGQRHQRPDHDPGLPPLLHRAHGRPDRSARRVPAG